MKLYAHNSFLVLFQDRVAAQCGLGDPGNPSKDQAALKLGDSPASAIGVLGLETFITTTRLLFIVVLFCIFETGSHVVLVVLNLTCEAEELLILLPLSSSLLG